MGSEQIHKRAAPVIGADTTTGGAIAERFERERMIACVTRCSADNLHP